MPRTQLAIIADDFTGANDTGLQFRKSGAHVGVILDLDDLDDALDELDVIVIDTESRSIVQQEAFENVRRVAELLHHKGVVRFYKKIDSTMRGNIGAEIEGAMTGAGLDIAWVVPALPAWGRTTRNGICYVNGMAVAETEAARDPKSPVSSSSIPDIIAQQSARKMSCIGLDKVRQGKAAILKAVATVRKTGAEVIVFDAVNEDDLAALGQAAADTQDRALSVGSTGWAAHLMNFKATALPAVRCDGSIVILAGSVSQVTREQIEHAQDQGEVEVINVDVEALSAGDYEGEKRRIVLEAVRRIEADSTVAIRSSQLNQDVAPTSEMSGQIVRFLGETARAVCEAVKVGGLVLTGGDTAIQTARTIGAAGTIIENEVLPGVPCSRLISRDFEDMPIVTKAGGFGERDALVRILDYLKGGDK
jgi:uncharacterized protein YgbK (DUF1537 family)